MKLYRCSECGAQWPEDEPSPCLQCGCTKVIDQDIDQVMEAMRRPTVLRWCAAHSKVKV